VNDYSFILTKHYYFLYRILLRPNSFLQTHFNKLYRFNFVRALLSAQSPMCIVFHIHVDRVQRIVIQEMTDVFPVHNIFINTLISSILDFLFESSINTGV
jgi:hypothetical protein